MSAPAQTGFRQWSRGGVLDSGYVGEPEILTHPHGAIEWYTAWGEPDSVYRFSGKSVSGPGLVINADYSGTGVITSRDCPAVQRADSEWLVGYVPLAGAVDVAWWRGDICLRPGQFGVVPSPEPVEVRISRRARTLTLFFPRELIDRLVPTAELPVARTLPANPALRLLVQHLNLTMQLGRSLDGSACAAATRAASELLAAAVSSADPESAECHDTVRITQVKHHIDRSLADPSLSVAGVAAANFVSPRTVQRLFAATTENASAYIRRRRLEMCYADILANPRCPSAKSASAGACPTVPT